MPVVAAGEVRALGLAKGGVQGAGAGLVLGQAPVRGGCWSLGPVPALVPQRYPTPPQAATTPPSAESIHEAARLRWGLVRVRGWPGGWGG